MKMRIGSKGVAAGLAAVLLVAACSSSSSKSGSSTAGAAGGTGGAAVKSSRGFDGTTIKVAGIEDVSQFSGAEIGAEARFKRANDTNELKGIKIQFVEVANDKLDPSTATSEARRLVTEDQVFAIVPDLSAVNPGPYLNAQHVPYVGYAFDATYCSPAPTTSLSGFGDDGCLGPTNPPGMPDEYGELYRYVSGKTHTAHPSMVVFSTDDQSGRNTVKFQASAAEGAGFNVVSAHASLPTVTSDYTPYVQQWLTADAGQQPDVINCETAAQCVPAWAAVKAAGYKGTFQQSLGNVDVLAKAMAGSVTYTSFNTAPNAGLTQMEADLQAFKPGTKPVGYSNVAAYFAADMFIQALKKVGRDVTPEAVQKALATQTWQIPGLAGPTQYPASTAIPTQLCQELLQTAPDGSGYTILAPFSCSSKTYKLDPKFSG